MSIGKQEAQAVLQDMAETNNLTLDVNFDEEHKDCIKFTLDGKQAIIKYTDVFAVMFTLANKEQQAKMMPVTQTLGHQYMKKITIKATKDLKEGELITVNVKINVPDVIAQAIINNEDTLPSTEGGI